MPGRSGWRERLIEAEGVDAGARQVQLRSWTPSYKLNFHNTGSLPVLSHIFLSWTPSCLRETAFAVVTVYFFLLIAVLVSL
jgi:hypothetical protein